MRADDHHPADDYIGRTFAQEVAEMDQEAAEQAAKPPEAPDRKVSPEGRRPDLGGSAPKGSERGARITPDRRPGTFSS